MTIPRKKFRYKNRYICEKFGSVTPGGGGGGKQEKHCPTVQTACPNLSSTVLKVD